MSKKKLIIAIVAFVAVIGILLGVYFITRPQPVDGMKNITVTVVHKDLSTKDFHCSTDAQYLGTVLLDEGIVEGEQGPYGLFIQSADGEQAVFENDGGWWCVYIGEESATTGTDQIVVTDGGVYRLVYTIG